MSYNKPAFDFGQYNPKDPWNFPGDRLVLFGIEAMEIFQPSRDWIKTRHRYPDVRFTVFHELIQLGHGAMSFGIFLRDEGSRREWWSSRPEFTKEYSRRMVQSFGMGLRSQFQLGFFHGVVHQVEAFFRQVATALAPNEMRTQEEAGMVVGKWVLEQVDKASYGDLLDILAVVRDSLHFNGKHCPPDRKDRLIEYKGVDYAFLNNEDIEADRWGYLDEWDFILFLLGEIRMLLHDVIEAEAVQECPLILARYLEDRGA